MAVYSYLSRTWPRLVPQVKIAKTKPKRCFPGYIPYLWSFPPLSKASQPLVCADKTSLQTSGWDVRSERRLDTHFAMLCIGRLMRFVTSADSAKCSYIPDTFIHPRFYFFVCENQGFTYQFFILCQTIACVSTNFCAAWSKLTKTASLSV